MKQWKDLDTTQTQSAWVKDVVLSESDAPYLIVINGSEAGALIRVDDKVSIGRADDMDLKIRSTGVSRVHCKVEQTAEGVVITDQDSKNGTAINGVRIKRRTLREGDLIQLGSFVVIKYTRYLGPEQSKAHESANCDPLTKLLNRRYFITRLEKEFAIASKKSLILTVLLTAIDSWPKLQKQYPKEKTERLLVAVAWNIQRHVRNQDLCARIHEEQFAVMFSDLRADAAEIRAQRIRREIDCLTDEFKSDTFGATMSGGLACIPSPGIKTPSELIEAAGQALARSRELGGNRICVSSGSYSSVRSSEPSTGAVVRPSSVPPKKI